MSTRSKRSKATSIHSPSSDSTNASRLVFFLFRLTIFDEIKLLRRGGRTRVEKCFRTIFVFPENVTAWSFWLTWSNQNWPENKISMMQILFLRLDLEIKRHFAYLVELLKNNDVWVWFWYFISSLSIDSSNVSTRQNEKEFLGNLNSRLSAYIDVWTFIV